MEPEKKFEILLRKLAQCINLANELQINIEWPCKVAGRTVIRGWHKQNQQELEFILARPKSDAVQ
jgi:hypothetical protein